PESVGENPNTYPDLNWVPIYLTASSPNA
ncbi:MAG: hypothetical protein ACJASX_003763, partial [Limisphaerales bacterium]